MQYLRALLIGALLCWVPSTAVAQKKPESVDCHRDLREAVELINDMWSFKLFKPGYVDLEAVYRELTPEARRAREPEACADLLARFMARLGDGHSRLHNFPGVERTAPYIAVRSQREELSQVPGERPPVHAYVFARDTTDSLLQVIAPGSEILTLDGATVDSLYRYMELRVAGSTDQWRDYICDRQLLMGLPETETELVYREPGGARKTLTLLRPPSDSDREEDLDPELKVHLGMGELSRWERLDGGWGYIRYTSFAEGGLENAVLTFYAMLDSLLDAPGLILDLRGNGGGYVNAITAIAGRFITEKQTMGFVNYRDPGQDVVYQIIDEMSGGWTDKRRLLAMPRGEPYTGPVVILIDSGCFSACEGFTGGLQSFDRALVIGPGASGGGSGFVGGLKLPSDAVISFSYSVAWLPNMQQIEGHGVRPNIRVRERPRDWAVGRDRVLERAIRALERGEAKPLAEARQGG